MRSLNHASRTVVAHDQVDRAIVVKCGMWLSHLLGQLSRICTASSGSTSSSRWNGASSSTTCFSYALVHFRTSDQPGIPRRCHESARTRAWVS